MHYGPAILAICLFLYAISSKRLSLTVFTGPLVFATLGWILGPGGLGMADPLAGERVTNIELITLLLEGTLVLVLFTDAMGTNITRWREQTTLPGRLLGVGLPLTMVAGWGLALLLFSDLSVWEAGLIAVILAPTDAALGQAVISNPRVPQRIRQALNIESGLNDGLALPVFFVVLEAAQASEASLGAGSLVREIVSQVFIAAAVGVALGWLAARLILWTAERDWMAPAWSKVAMLAVALGAWVFGDGLGGSGFLAAWIAGLIIGRELRETQPGIGEFTEDTSHVLTLLSFFVFGAFVLGDVIDGITWQVALYAVLSLTAIRILPVAVAMSGSGLRSQSVLYLGWFGPRGLASIILVATIVEESELAGSDTITLVMAATVGLSIYAHGASAWWGSNRYADWYESQGDHAAELPESDEVAHVPVSRRFGHID